MNRFCKYFQSQYLKSKLILSIASRVTSTVDGDIWTRDVRRRIRSQKSYRTGNFFRLTRSPNGMRRSAVLQKLGVRLVVHSGSLVHLQHITYEIHAPICGSNDNFYKLYEGHRRRTSVAPPTRRYRSRGRSRRTHKILQQNYSKLADITMTNYIANSRMTFLFATRCHSVYWRVLLAV